jgi:hypothetical protein
MIQIEKLPNKVVLAGQTIPFIVTTDLFDDEASFDAIERSFKYLFEIKTMDDLGNYRTYSTVAIPPRPDNLVGFMDAAPLIKSAITWDNGTNLNEDASPCPKSIVKFFVQVTERYLDENGDYINGQTLGLGEYIAIYGAVSEGLTQYLIDGTDEVKSPLHHYQLLGKQLEIRPNEGLTTSFIVEPELSENALDFSHGDFGSFDFGTIDQYTGITGNLASLVKTNTATLSGSALRAQIPSSLFVTSDTEGELFSFTGLNLLPNTKYEFIIYARLVGSLFNAPSTSTRYYAEAKGGGIGTPIVQVFPSVRSSALKYQKIVLKFDTNSTIAEDEYIEIGVRSEITNDVIKLNKRAINFDSATLYGVNINPEVPNEARVVVDRGLSTEITYGFSTMMSAISSYEQISQYRFDINSGVNFIFDGPDQDTVTGFYLANNLLPGKYYEIELFNSDNPLKVIAKTEKIYQVNDCDRYNSVRLKWLNDLGAWDYYTFTKVSVASKRVEKETYKITSGEITQSGGDFDYIEDVANIGYKVLNIRENDFIIINSDWIKGDVAKFLKQIIKSKQVYMLNPGYYMDVEQNINEYPVIVNDAEFEYSNNSKEAKLTNATFTLQLGTPFNNKTTNI